MKLTRKAYIKAATLVIAVLCFIATACDNYNEVGTDLVSDEVAIVADSSFTLTAHSVMSERVLSRTTMQMIGNVQVPEYGYISSDFVTQFMPAIQMDTTYVTPETVDSLKLEMLVSYGGFVGDSMAIMGLEVYPLVKQLETPIFSNFNPEGYYDANNPIGSLVYNLTKSVEPDSIKNNQYYTLSVNLPVEMGRDFYREYLKNPAIFASPIAFAKYFPGLYVKSTYGSGRITRIGNTTMKMFYHQNFVNDNGNDTTIYKVGSYFAVTPEIITNNDIKLDISSSVLDRVAAGDAIMLAPAGMDVELRFPAPEIISAYKAGTAGSLGVVNTLGMRIPVENIENKYNISAPTDVLLVLKKDRDNFFMQNQLPDNKTSFRATLETLADGTQVYAFSDMRQYILDLMSQETVNEEDYTFILMPVNAITESSSDMYGSATVTLTGIAPYVAEPKMTRILVDKSKINFVYSKQTTNF